MIANEEDKYHTVGIYDCIFQAVPTRQIKLPDIPILYRTLLQVILK